VKGKTKRFDEGGVSGFSGLRKARCQSKTSESKETATGSMAEISAGDDSDAP
jgi:hypothetical protein